MSPGPVGPGPLTAEQILDAAREVLRRYGPGKATVVDVARALGVTHGSVYRHFPSKTALREAVTRRWLDEIHQPLARFVTGPEPAGQRLRGWLLALFQAKSSFAAADPELFGTYVALAGEASTVVGRHVAELLEQLRELIAGGVASGEFAAGVDPGVAARAVLHATTRFHHPGMAAQWRDPGARVDLEHLCDLLLDGLRGRPA